jgi:hypothetical protein
MTQPNANTVHTFKMTEAQAEMLFELVISQLTSLKNWTVSAVEEGNFERAQKLAADVRKHQDLFRGFNIRSMREVSEVRETPMPTTHDIR